MTYLIDEKPYAEDEFRSALEADLREHSDYDDALDASYSKCYIEGVTLYPSDILKKCDPIAYNCGKEDYLTSLFESALDQLERYGEFETKNHYYETVD